MFWGYFCSPETNYLAYLVYLFAVITGTITLAREYQIRKIQQAQK